MSQQKARIDVLDYVRALAIIHIFMYHYYLEWFHGSFLIEPGSIARNFERLQVFQDGGFAGAIKNIFSFLFVYGFTSVNLFLVLSGFVLTYSFIKGGEFLVFRKAGDWIGYYWKRCKRLLIPFYISVLVGALFLFARNFLFPALGGPPLFNGLDILKLFFVPFLFYDIQFLQLFNGDYWFIPLILQLYLLFPLLFWFLKKTGVRNFLIGSFVACASYRLYASYNLSSVPMGVLYPAENSYRFFSFFLPRLFEFAFGMGLASFFASSEKTLVRLRGFLPVIAGIILTFGGFLLNMCQWGWAFSDPVMAVGLLLLFLNIGGAMARSTLIEKILKKISDAAYEIFLLHHYFLNYFLMPLLIAMGVSGNETVFWITMPLFFISSVVLGGAGRRLSLLAERIRLRSRP